MRLRYLLLFLIGTALGLSINFSYSFKNITVVFLYGPAAAFLCGWLCSYMGKITGWGKFIALALPELILLITSMYINPNWMFGARFVFVIISLYAGVFFMEWTKRRKEVVYISYAAYFLLIPLFSFYIAPAINHTQREQAMMEMLPPDSVLINTNGQFVHLSDFRGKVLILDFWNTRCGACIRQMNELEKVDKKYRDNPDVAIISINTGNVDDFDQFKEFITERSFQLSFLYDINSNFCKKLKIEGLPVNMIIDKNGMIRFRYTGFSNEEAGFYRENICRKIDEIMKE